MTKASRRSAVFRAATRRRGRLLAAGVALSAMAATALAWRAVSVVEADREQSRFDRLADQFEDGIRARLDRQAADLRAVTGLFAASRSVERPEFRQFAAQQRRGAPQPGVVALVYIERVVRTHFHPWLAATRADGAPGYAVTEPGPLRDAPDLLVAKYVEPAAGNADIVGLDVGTIPGTRTALEAARDRDEPRLSAAIPGSTLPRVVLYLPVYANERRATTPGERRDAVVGWVAGVLEVREFLAAVRASVEEGVAVDVFDSSPALPARSLLDGQPARPLEPDARGHARTTSIDFGGRTWVLRVSATTDWRGVGATAYGWIVLAFGVAVSALVAAVVFALTRTRRLAETFAERATTHLARQAKEIEVARDQAMAATRAKSDFLAAVSHEIRTPLNGVLGTSRLLLDSGLSVEQAEQVRTILSSGEVLLGVLNDVLDVSKIEAGRLDLAREPFDLREAVEDVLDLLVPQATAKGLEIVLRWARGAPSTFVGDALRWKQVMLNLAGNAVKFTDRGHVLVEVTTASAPGDDGAQVEVRVTDTGVGIAAEQLPLLFRRFSQVDPSVSRRHGGTGLGLLICRLLVERMGGTIEVASRPDEGTTFCVSVPMPRGVSERRTAPEAAPCPVLVVDDLEPARVAAREIVESETCAVVEAEDGEGALAALRDAAAQRAPVGVAFVDGDLPDTDGFAFARVVRGDPSIAATRLVLLASAPRAGFADAARAAGFDGWLGKPLRARDVRDALAELAKGDRAPSDAFLTHGVLAAARRRGHPKADERDACHRASCRVLLVEDNEVNARVAMKMLERLGCRIEWARGGAAAIDAASRGSFELVLMDLRMPGIDGYQAAGEIRSGATGGHRVPIVAMTADVTEEEQRRCREGGLLDDFLGKPVDLDGLKRILVRWCPATAADVRAV